MQPYTFSSTRRKATAAICEAQNSAHHICLGIWEQGHFAERYS
jgi:hypothetical protein